MLTLPERLRAEDVEFARRLAEQSAAYAVEVERRYRGLRHPSGTGRGGVSSVSESAGPSTTPQRLHNLRVLRGGANSDSSAMTTCHQLDNSTNHAGHTTPADTPYDR
jgi:hypothetical protein